MLRIQSLHSSRLRSNVIAKKTGSRLPLDAPLGNLAVIQDYEREGIVARPLDPRMGSAQFFLKLLVD